MAGWRQYNASIKPVATSPDTIAYHQERSRHFLDLVDDELARGELEEASKKVWGAAAHAIKAVAERRGWEHHAHNLMEQAVDRLVREEGAPIDLWIQYLTASAYHQRFYGGPPPADAIRVGKELIAQFIDALERLD